MAARSKLSRVALVVAMLMGSQSALAAEKAAESGATGETMVFMRSGATGVQGHCPMLWAGDQAVDFSRHDGIGTVIRGALSSGLVGNAYHHSDLGGYTSLYDNVRTAELLMRWSELSAFSPVMRSQVRHCARAR